jgi:arylsulfatase
MRTKALSYLVTLLLALGMAAPGVEAADKPNILVIMPDDVGWFNVSAYNMGMMGYRTPNIDRIAKEGAMFTDAYAQQSCTAGRAAFITGQSPIRTGLLRVGMPGADLGLQKEDPTLAELLKNHGYMTGQFGKNHLGDRNEFLPTVHGFDEFFGNLYHLNAEEEPENEDYPKDPAFKKEFGPRGVLDCKATDKNDSTVDPRFGRVGKQTIKDTGPLTRERMETADEEFIGRTLDFMDRAHNAQKPFFVWFNPTRMHVWTHLKKESRGVTGQGLYADGMAEHDGHVGRLLKKLDDLGIADNTIVVWTTDNGAEVFSWPDGGTTPFAGEKNTNWEGGYRVPMMVRWPAKIKAGIVSNEVISMEDWVSTLMAAIGETDIKEKLLKGHKANGKKFKVHLDSYNFLPYLTGAKDKGSRQEFLYWNDGGQLVGLRYNDWKLVFMEQREHGWNVWAEPMIPLRFPKVMNLRRDPFERAHHESDFYNGWWVNRMYTLIPAQTFVKEWLQSFKEFPVRQRPAVFNLDKVLSQMETAGSR